MLNNITYLHQQVHLSVPQPVVFDMHQHLQRYSDRVTCYGSISLSDGLYLFLYYLRTGQSFRTLQLMFGYPKSNMTKLFWSLAETLERWAIDEIEDSRSFIERQRLISLYHPDHPAPFNSATLIVDGIHLQIEKSSKVSVPCDRYYSYKSPNKCAISVQVMVTHDRRVVYVSPPIGARHHDKFCFDLSAPYIRGVVMKDAREKIIADGAYQGIQREGFIAVLPFKARAGARLSSVEVAFNKEHAKIRSTIEHTFADIKNRFQMFKVPLRHKQHIEQQWQYWLVACAVHNNCIQPLGAPDEDVEEVTL